MFLPLSLFLPRFACPPKLSLLPPAKSNTAHLLMWLLDSAGSRSITIFTNRRMWKHHSEYRVYCWRFSVSWEKESRHSNHWWHWAWSGNIQLSGESEFTEICDFHYCDLFSPESVCIFCEPLKMFFIPELLKSWKGACDYKMISFVLHVIRLWVAELPL